MFIKPFYMSSDTSGVILFIPCYCLHSSGAIWPSTLFNLYICLLSAVVKHSLIVGYVDEHSLLKIISDKYDCVTAASQLNEYVEAISQFGKVWQIRFAPNKTFSL